MPSPATALARYPVAKAPHLIVDVSWARVNAADCGQVVLAHALDAVFLDGKFFSRSKARFSRHARSRAIPPGGGPS